MADFPERALKALRTSIRRERKSSAPTRPVFEVDAPPETNPRPYEEIAHPLDLSAPILFLARGHSGTTPVAKILRAAGVYVGNTDSREATTPQWDSMYWSYGFDRVIIPRFFKAGAGCLVDERTVARLGMHCLKLHLMDYPGGRWGFKTVATMFCHEPYRYLFPHAKFIYLVRDGRDVVLSNEGYFQLSSRSPKATYWDYFKTITFGFSDDLLASPFTFPSSPFDRAEIEKHRFWIQAKSWREHVRVVEHLRKTGSLSPEVYLLRYEALCSDPSSALAGLFHFLELELTGDVIDFAAQHLHARSIGRWKDYRQYVGDWGGDMISVFESMSPELELLGYVD